MVVLVLKRPPGGGGAWTAFMMACVAWSSEGSPEERVIEWLTTRPDGPTVKATPTEPVTPAARAAAG